MAGCWLPVLCCPAPGGAACPGLAGRWVAVQVEMRQIIEAERAASGAVKQLKWDLKEEKTEHEERVRLRRGGGGGGGL